MTTSSPPKQARTADGPNLELIVAHPDGSALVRGFLRDEEPAAHFFGAHYGTLDAFRAKMADVDERFDRAARERAVEAVIVPPGADASRVERFVEEGGYMVTTGQQPGLFGGPLYNLTKGLTAVRLAETLEERLDRPVLPLFWVSSEDHDWEEASHADVVGVDNELHRVALAPPDPHVAAPLHRIPLGTEITSALAEFVGYLPTTDFSKEYVELLEVAFVPGRTIAEAFHTVIQRLLGRFGLFFTDGAHPALKRHTASFLLSELERAQEMEDVLRSTASELEADGFGLQVPILEGSVNLFLEGPAGRERLYRDGDGFRLRTSGEHRTLEEIAAQVEADPLVLSPNVLLRPVAESAIFPTLSYVGGPGELAYFGELGAYFRAHGIAMPVVHPRWAATPVEGKIRKVLDKFDLDVGALDRPFHELAGDVAREEMPADVRQALGKLRGAIGGGLGELKRAATGIDKTLAGPVQQAGSQAMAALDDLEKKVLQAVKRESEIGLAQLEKAQVHLYPLGKPAERVQSPFYYLTRYGGSVLDALYERFGVNLF